MKYVDDELFKLPPVESPVPMAGPVGKTCRDCRHMRRHLFTEKINYCAKGTSKHTPNGLAKTKRLAPACWAFEAKEGRE